MIVRIIVFPFLLAKRALWPGALAEGFGVGALGWDIVDRHVAPGYDIRIAMNSHDCRTGGGGTVPRCGFAHQLVDRSFGVFGRVFRHGHLRL